MSNKGLWATFINSRTKGIQASTFWSRLKPWELHMRQNSRLLINNGSSDFWKDNWLGCGPLYYKYEEALWSNSSIKIKDLCRNGTWYLRELHSALLHEDIEAILGETLQLNQRKEDEIIWQLDNMGAFSVKSAYQSLRRRGSTYQPAKFYWHHRLQTKISIFMWKLFNNLLPLADVLQGIGFHQPSICVLCHSNTENINHTFFTCNYSQFIWNYFAGILTMQGSVTTSSELLSTWWTRKGASKVMWELKIILPSMINWFIWKARNKAYFEGVLRQKEETIRLVICELRLMASTTPFRTTSISEMELQHTIMLPLTFIRKSQPKILHWSCPPKDHFKLNVDGSAINNPGNAGCGAVLRNEYGNVVAAESKFIQHATNFEAEAQALLMGLNLCLQNDIRKIEVESDSRTLLQTLFNADKWPWKLRSVLSQIVSTTHQFSSITFRHVYREINAVADELANLGSRNRIQRQFSQSTLPQRLKGLIMLDQRAFPYIRYVKS